MKVLQIVDSKDYIISNCYQHQLHKALKNVSDLTLCNLSELQRIDIEKYDSIISTLKMRSVFKHTDQIAKKIGNRKITIYDQDPWESFREGGACINAYDIAASKMNVRFIVTTPWWIDYLREKKFNVSLVNMGVLPEYCSSTPELSSRNINVGFIGSLHSHRQDFLAAIQQHHDVNIVGSSNKPYKEFLEMLSDIKIYVRSDNMQMKLIDGTITNMNFGMFAKDIEVAARGGFSLRDASDGTIIACEGIDTIVEFSSREEAIDIIYSILSKDPNELNETCKNAVELIKARNYWDTAAKHMIQI